MTALPTPNTVRLCAELFGRYFGALREQGIQAVVLHGYEGFPDSFPSDIDFAVADKDLRRAISILHDVCAESGWLVAQILQHEIFAFYCVAVFADDPRYILKFDVCSHYVRNGKVFIEDRQLLQDAHPHKDFLIPAVSSEFLYVLSKALAKGKTLDEVAQRLRILYRKDASGCRSVLLKLFGGSMAGSEEINGFGFLEHGLNLPAARDLGRDYPLSLRFREWMRRLRRLIFPTGLTIAVLGVDGSGKTTLIKNLSSILSPCFRRCEILHFRPGLGSPRTTEVVQNPHAKPPRGFLMCWSKTIYYWLDWWLGTLFVVRPAECRSTLFFFDRHLVDVLVDPQRYRLRGSLRLARFLIRCGPKPDLLFGLAGDVHAIAKRKGEVSPAEMDRQQKEICRVAASSPEGAILDAEREESSLAVSAAVHAVRFLAARCERRFRLG